MITKRALKRYIDKAIAQAIKRHTDAFDWHSFIMKISEKVIKPLNEIAHSSPDRMAELGAVKALVNAKDAMKMSEQIAGRVAAKKANEPAVALVKFGESKKIDVLNALRAVFDVAKKYATQAKTVPAESRKLFGVGQRALSLMVDLQSNGKEFVPKEEVVKKSPSFATVEKMRQKFGDLLHSLIKRGKISKSSDGWLVTTNGSEVMKTNEAMNAINSETDPGKLRQLLSKLLDL